jgi:NAD(P)-dependent dehydrogenase (short-subunit alcohol dehydrogenase family)
VQTFEFEGVPGHVSLDTYTLAELDGKTLMRSVSSFQSVEDRDGMIAAGLERGVRERPVVTAVRTMFLTARAAARHMIRQRSGVILIFGGYEDPVPGVGGLQVAFGALESLRRALACERGPSGIRVVTRQTGGIPETLPEGFGGRQAIIDDIAGRTMLGRDLPYCTAHGPTPHEAVAEVEQAVTAWLDAAKAAGRPVPEPSLLAAHA